MGDLGLERQGPLDPNLPRGLCPQQVVHPGRVAQEHRRFQQLVAAVFHLPFGKGLKKFRASHQPLGGMKGSNQILARGEVRSSLATQASIRHGEQGGGPGLPSDAAHVERSRETREIAEHAAAHGHHSGVPVQGQARPLLQPGEDGL